MLGSTGYRRENAQRPAKTESVSQCPFTDYHAEVRDRWQMKSGETVRVR